MRRLVTGGAITEPRLQFGNEAAFNRGSQHVVVRHLVNGIAEKCFQCTANEPEREFVGVLEALNHAVSHKFGGLLVFGLTQPLVELVESVFKRCEVEGWHGRSIAQR